MDLRAASTPLPRDGDAYSRGTAPIPLIIYRTGFITGCLRKPSKTAPDIDGNLFLMLSQIL